MFRTLLISVCLALVSACGCNGKKGGTTIASKPKAKPPYAVTAEEIIRDIKAQQAMVTSYKAKPVMDYWFNNNRIKGDVWIMGKPGAKVRINALNPSGGTTAADLACNGTTFKFVNVNNNCQLTGPCDATSIAQLLRVRMNPDDFLMLAIGSAPIIDYQKSEVSWDKDAKLEVLELWSADGQVHQIIKLRKRAGGRDLMSAEVRDAAGKTEWKLRNKDFSDHKTASGKAIRLPGKTNYVQPKQQNADVLVYWDKRELNIDITDDKFDFQLPGIPTCGRKPSPTAPAAKP